MKHLINNKYRINTIDKENIEDTPFVYCDTYDINRLINQVIYNNDSLIFRKENDNITIEINNYNLDKYLSINCTNELDKNIKTILNILDSTKSMSIMYSNDEIIIFSNEYVNILNNCSIKEKDYYKISKDNLELLFNEIKRYNELIKESLIKIDKDIDYFDLRQFKEYYKDNNMIIILNNDTGIKLILKGDINTCYSLKNKNMFINVYLPEILNIYIEKNNKLYKEEKYIQYNNSFYNINSNLYILNFKNDILDANIEYLHNMYKHKEYLMEINQNYIKKDIIEINNLVNKTEKNYSFGYINILLISFILSVITIVICLLS